MLLYSKIAISWPCRYIPSTILKKTMQMPIFSANYQSAAAHTDCMLSVPDMVDISERISEPISVDSLNVVQESGSSNGMKPLEKVKRKALERELGAFQHMPIVASANEIFSSAAKKARNVGPTKGINNLAKRERNKGAKQLDALTKGLILPLRTYVEKFPRRHQLHAYEYALIDLTFGTGKYEEVLENVSLFRKKILNVGKNFTFHCARTTSKREAEECTKEGFFTLEEHFKRSGDVVDELLKIAKTLRAIPVFNIKTPTLCLVGAPNVGKSSLVRVLSTGKPEVCNYPFTTRGISMGHIFVQTDVYQVTDTPGLLKRPDDERNNMEKLTLAALSHLPTAVLYVHDLTGDCGMKVLDQLKLYREIKSRFSDRPWLDVVSKSDLLPPPSRQIFDLASDTDEFYEVFGPKGAIWVSVETNSGVDELRRCVLELLTRNFFDQMTSQSANPEEEVVKR